MADTKISALPTAISVDGSEQIPAVKLGSTQKITPAQIKTYLGVSGVNTGDQDLSALALKSTTVNGQPLSANVTVTKADVGLGNAENTSDANKPISTATALAIAAKQDTLVSTTNIKTINGNSILGAGDLTLSGAGTVTSASVVSANGFAGTVATATTTPAITLSTSVTGLLKGNGTAIAAAVAGTDIKTINSASLIGSGDIAVGTVTTASVATANGFAGTVSTVTTTPVITLTTNVAGLLKGNGTALSAAVSGTDIKTVNSTSVLGSGDILTPVGFRNKILNGGMRLDQRDSATTPMTVNSTSNIFATDMWYGSGQAADGVFTVGQSTTAPAGAKYSLLATVTTADASLGASQQYILGQHMEGLDVIDLAFGTASAKTVTVSFQVHSSVTGTFGGSLMNSATNRSYPFSYSISAANTWESKTITIPGDTTGTWLTDTGIGLRILFGLGVGSTLSGTAGAWAAATYANATGATNLMATSGATFRITNVQLEIGSSASTFEAIPFSTLKSLCQRYCQVITLGNGFIAPFTGFCQTSTAVYYQVPYKCSMRAAATFAASTQTNWSVNTGTGSTATTALSLSNSTVDGAFLVATTSGQTAGQAASLSAIAATQTLTFTSQM